MVRWSKILVVVLTCLSVTAVSAAEQNPRQVIETTVQEIINVLEARVDQDSISEADREAIRKVVHGKFDYREMSRRSVGKPWNDMSDAKQTEFTDIFRQMLEYSYGNRLAAYHGQKVEFGEPEYKHEKARVSGAVVDATKSIPMEYRLHQTATGWQVYDIKIEGVSMITTFRQDFKSIIKKNGVDGLMVDLQDKVEKLKEKS